MRNDAVGMTGRISDTSDNVRENVINRDAFASKKLDTNIY